MGSRCQKSLLKSLFYFYFLISIYWKKLQNHTSLSSLPYQGFSGLIRFSSAREAPHFCTNCKHCGRLIHDRKMHNILCARFRSTVSPHERNVEIKCIAWQPLTSKKFMPCYRTSGWWHFYFAFFIIIIIHLFIYVFMDVCRHVCMYIYIYMFHKVTFDWCLSQLVVAVRLWSRNDQWRSIRSIRRNGVRFRN